MEIYLRKFFILFRSNVYIWLKVVQRVRTIADYWIRS